MKTTTTLNLDQELVLRAKKLLRNTLPTTNVSAYINQKLFELVDEKSTVYFLEFFDFANKNWVREEMQFSNTHEVEKYKLEHNSRQWRTVKMTETYI